MRKRIDWSKWNEWLEENYQHLTTREIAERIGCSMGAVRQQANELHLKKFPDDISFFENWTSESAYIIGLWAADGYANVRPGKGVAVSITQSHGGGICEMFPDILDCFWKDTGQFLFAQRKHGAHAGWMPRPKMEQLELPLDRYEIVERAAQ